MNCCAISISAARSIVFAATSRPGVAPRRRDVPGSLKAARAYCRRQLEAPGRSPEERPFGRCRRCGIPDAGHPTSPLTMRWLLGVVGVNLVTAAAGRAGPAAGVILRAGRGNASGGLGASGCPGAPRGDDLAAQWGVPIGGHGRSRSASQPQTSPTIELDHTSPLVPCWRHFGQGSPGPWDCRGLTASLPGGLGPSGRLEDVEIAGAEQSRVSPVSGVLRGYCPTSALPPATSLGSPLEAPPGSVEFCPRSSARYAS